jgi:hypothetical protein
MVLNNVLPTTGLKKIKKISIMYTTIILAHNY